MSEDEIDFLGGLDDEPIAPEPVSPKVPATVPAVPSRWREPLAFVGVIVIAVALTGGVTAWWIGGQGDGPGPTANAVSLGRSFTPILAGTLADGFDAEANALEVGKDITEGNLELKRVFDSGRKAAFDRHAGSLITSIVPDGKTIDSPEIRRALVQAHRDFAKGLRGGK